ncbi:YktB family protein [Metabacillus sp. 84]|uniref:YktB family protein n=1 Tax=unclassified Metabacillus TaxID=2675274 RepID=UPI003CF0E1DF
MNFTGFEAEDFEVFAVNGLEERMEMLVETVRPKLEALGVHFSAMLSQLTGEEMFPHVAKHARRSVNPPNDTWVAFASSKRGYKMLPHFQIGLWETHVFIWFAMIYEAPGKEAFGKAAEKKIPTIVKQIPGHYVWSDDHTKPGASPQEELGKAGLKKMAERLQSVKKAEMLCGVHINRQEAEAMSGEEMITRIEQSFQTLLPLYQLAQRA